MSPRNALMMFLLAVLITAMSVTAQSEDAPSPGKRDWSARFVYQNEKGQLVYDRNERGDQIPDFSHCGYRGGGVPLPAVPARIKVLPTGGDNGPLLKAAIDHVASLPLDQNGFRGAVLLGPGTFRISGSLEIRADGVVLRGSGTSNDSLPARTTVVADGQDRRSLIRISGTASPVDINTPSIAIADEYVPGGATEFAISGEHSLLPGELICIEHRGTAAWIEALGMNRFPSRDQGSWLDWRPETMNIRWLRTVTGVDRQRISIDAPLTFGLDSRLSTATVRKCTRQNLVSNVGIENLICVSEVAGPNPKDEDHAWIGIHFEHAQDAWVRSVTFRGFSGSAVQVLDDCRRVTVSDCDSAAPVSERAGWRRHTYDSAGQQTLFLRCRAEDGRHDFAVGHLAAGPNAFSWCESVRASEFSGPIGSWASGVLYDNVTIDGAPLALTNRETDAQGTGWSAANCVLWNCVAPEVICRMPPTAQNWAIGVWGEFTGDGHWRQLNEFVDPDSLLGAQLVERLGKSGVAALEPGWLPTEDDAVPVFSQVLHASTLAVERKHQLKLDQGLLTIDGRLASGKRIGTQWWRGSVLPDRVDEFAVGVTRFVPGRDGQGLTDDLDQLTNSMQRDGVIALEHHWGLWYDRRRDDHQIVRRIDGAVWPPFYEQPWARSGQGRAWDGLSQYDLTRFNPWYFSRLRTFAEHCDNKGLILIAHMYFQHNLLEAGAHWADFPWRPANCLQSTGFPEPPPLENRKRVHLANDFYDISHPERRRLHKLYIQHYLDSLSPCNNVIYTTGEEFTGPAAFMDFWLDTIAAWQQERQRNVYVALSCTRDVQDAILNKAALTDVVDIIDLKYWWYTADGGEFAPAGGQQLAPRQQLREHRGGSRYSEASVARAIREYREKFPDKAVICSLPDLDSATVLAAGGSLPDSIPSNADLPAFSSEK